MPDLKDGFYSLKEIFQTDKPSYPAASLWL